MHAHAQSEVSTEMLLKVVREEVSADALLSVVSDDTVLSVVEAQISNVIRCWFHEARSGS